MKFYLFILCSVLVGCSAQDANPFETVDNNVESLVSTRIVDLEEYDILRADKVLSYNGCYIFQDVMSQSSKYTLLSCDLKSVKRGVPQGQGEGEVTMVVRMSVSGDSLYVMEPNASRLSTLKVDDDVLSVKHTSSFGSMIGLSYQPLPDGNVIMSTFDPNEFILLVDHDGNVLSRAEKPVLNDIPEICSYNIFPNTFVVSSPDGKHFAYSMIYAKSFGFGDIANSSIVYTKQVCYGDILFDYSDSSKPRISKDNLLCAIDAASSPNYAMFLYSGKVYSRDSYQSDLVLLYDWNGKNYRWLKLDHALTSIGYDSDRHILFGLADMPEVHLVEYSIEL